MPTKSAYDCKFVRPQRERSRNSNERREEILGRERYWNYSSGRFLSKSSILDSIVATIDREAFFVDIDTNASDCRGIFGSSLIGGWVPPDSLGSYQRETF